MSWLTDQIELLKDFWRADFRRVPLFCGLGMLLIAAAGFAAAAAAPESAQKALTAQLQAIMEAGILDEEGNMSVFALLMNNWRAMLISALYGFIPFLFLPVLSLFLNGALLGIVAAVYKSNGISLLVYAAGILPHGIFEIPALILSIACGIYLCRNLCRMIMRSSKQAPLVELLGDLLRVMLLIVLPLTVLAAVMECYVTPLVMGLFL